MNTSNKINYSDLLFTPTSIHCSLDLETLSDAHDAHIIQIGAVMWNREGYLGQFNLHLDPQEPINRSRSAETLQWWDAQDPELRKYVFSGKITLLVALGRFKNWCEHYTNGRPEDINFWSNGPEFDMVVLQSAYEHYMEYPFNFRRNHSVRTAKAVLTQKELDYCNSISRVKHNAFDDAMYQAQIVQTFLTKHGVGRF